MKCASPLKENIISFLIYVISIFPVGRGLCLSPLYSLETVIFIGHFYAKFLLPGHTCHVIGILVSVQNFIMWRQAMYTHGKRAELIRKSKAKNSFIVIGMKYKDFVSLYQLKLLGIINID